MINENVAKSYGITAHAAVNQMYDKFPYSHHLQMVRDFAEKFQNEADYHLEIVYSACWLHDIIEDARQSYNDVKRVVGFEIAEISFALQTEKGRTRSERANDKYYQGIIETPGARFVKICDRLANMTYSKNVQSRMFDIYQSELDDFDKKLNFDNRFPKMFEYLRTI